MKYPWKVGLYLAIAVFAVFLMRYGKFFSDTFTVPSWILVIGAFLYAGFMWIRRLGDGSRMKAYIKEHEAWALLLLAVSLVAGTMVCVAVQSRLDAARIESPKITHP